MFRVNGKQYPSAPSITKGSAVLNLNIIFIFRTLFAAKLILAAFVTSLLYSQWALAQQSVLQVLPTRVLMQDNVRASTITLINRGDEEGSYRIFFRNIRANDDGEFTEVHSAIEGENFADELLRYSPRRITIPPRSKQNIRVLLRKPQGLSEGEYRSHLVFRKLPAQNSVLDQVDADREVALSIKPIVEVTIPVIVRHGETHATMSLSGLKIDTNSESKQSLAFTINREGNRSIYGDVDVWWLAADGKKENIALARGVSVYTPNDKRHFAIPLNSTEPLINNGKIKVEFQEDESYGGSLIVDAELTL